MRKEEEPRSLNSHVYTLRFDEVLLMPVQPLDLPTNQSALN